MLRLGERTLDLIRGGDGSSLDECLVKTINFHALRKSVEFNFTFGSDLCHN